MTEIVSNLCDHYAKSAISTYRGNLSSVLNCVEKNWIPTENDPSATSYVKELRRFLAARGEDETDSFLLHFGITVPGTQRGIEPPILALVENRGGYKEKRQKESASQVIRLREAITLGKSLFSNLPEQSLDAIRVLDAFATQKRKVSDEAKLEDFSNLSEDERHEFAGKAIVLLQNRCKAVQGVGIDMLTELICFAESALPRSVISALLELRVHWPAILFRDSGEETAAQLLNRIQQGSSRLDLDHLLLSFAWSNSELSRSTFVQWLTNPPKWCSMLNISVVDYAVYAGWSVNQRGEPSPLVEKKCYRLPISSVTSKSLVSSCIETESTCISCDGKLSLLFDFRKLSSHRRKELFIGNRMNAPVVFQTCLHCSAYQTVFDRYSDNETIDRISPVTICDFPNDEVPMESVHRTLAEDCTSPYAAAQPFLLDDASSVGGMPSWLQDAEFPRCVECNERMLFFGQHDNGSVSEEGIYYAFFCPTCQISAVNFQQT